MKVVDRHDQHLDFEPSCQQEHPCYDLMLPRAWDTYDHLIVLACERFANGFYLFLIQTLKHIFNRLLKVLHFLLRSIFWLPLFYQ